MIHFAKRMLETAWYLAVILGFLTLVDRYAHGADLISLDKVSLEYLSYLPGNIEPMVAYNGLPDRTLDKGLNLHINATILNYLYWNSMVWSITDKSTDGNGDAGQFRAIGLETQLGLRLSDSIDIGYYHFSKHWLDTSNSSQHFPVQDAIQLTIKIYDAHKRPDTLF